MASSLAGKGAGIAIATIGGLYKVICDKKRREQCADREFADLNSTVKRHVALQLGNALNVAFLAADAGEPVQMKHLYSYS